MAYENVSKYRDQIYRCNTCCRCPRGPWDPNQPEKLPTPSKQCPIYEQHESLASSSQGMILIIRDLLEGKLEATQELVDHMYECLLCEGCNAVCEGMDSIPLGSIEGAQIFRALRADFVEMGLEPVKGLKKFLEGIEENHNRQGSEKDRNVWAEGLGVADKAEIILFTGCTAAYVDSLSATSLVKIAQKAQLDFGVLKDEWCCGCLQIDSGYLDAFKASAEHNVAAIRAAGAKTVVTICADCYKALKYDYPLVVGELGFEVIHASELIERCIESGGIRLKAVDLGGVGTYSDPCFLARGKAPVIDAPRAVLKAIPESKWVEMEGCGKYTYCCGRPLTAPASAQTFKKTGIARIGDAQRIAAKTLVTSCVNCKSSLASAAKKDDVDVRVVDIAVLVAEAME